MPFTRSDFGNDFSWGVSTAAYQIEGAHDADGKGPSIWDTFTGRRKKIYANHHGNVSCDFYHRYADDLTLMADLHIRHYRFSISWSRIFPLGTGAINPAGVAYYDRVINACLARGITPWVTLYHWDLPQHLQNKGGWTNRDVVSWFLAYVSFCITQYGDRVKHWMVLNEPMVFTGAGYFLGVHAPGKKGLSNFLAAAHHAALCQAGGGRLIRSMQPGARIGTTFSYSHIEPFGDRAQDQIAAGKADALMNRLFLEPMLGLGYPVQEVRILRRIERYMKSGDEEKLKFEADFIGLQIYTREKVRYAPFIPFVQAKIIKASERNVSHTQMNWEVYPPSIYLALQKLASYKNIPEIIVTENGAAFHDEYKDGQVKDPLRQQYLQDHIEQVLRAKQEGIRVNGYFVWTFLDNFEWAEGYFPRFGIVHVNFETQQRIVKSSGNWYADFLR